MKRAQDIFHEVYDDHFGGDERALHTAICSFAATLPQPERDILLQCDLGGRSAQSVGAEIGLCRRQVQRHRKNVRSKFIAHVSEGAARHSSPVQLPVLDHRDSKLPRRAEMMAQSLRGEPAKATAKRLGISVRTLWRERARIREAQHDAADQTHRKNALGRLLADVETSWMRDDYAACSRASHSALAIARGVRPDGADAAEQLFRTFIWGEVIERTVGSAKLADAYFTLARNAAAECALAPRQTAFLRMREMIQCLRDPAGYATAYETTLGPLCQAMPGLLVDVVQAEIFDALEMQQLATMVRRAAGADVVEAPRNDVARTRVAVLGMCLRRGYENIARRCIADVRAWTRPDSRSAMMAEAYEAFIFASRENIARTRTRLRALAAHFRAAGLPAENATVLYLAARLCAESGEVRDAGEFIEEAWDAAAGRVSAKMQRDLLRYAALAFGGRHRQRLADAFAEAMTTARLRMS